LTIIGQFKYNAGETPLFAMEQTEYELLGISEAQFDELRKWNHKDQPHYSLETRRRLAAYQVIHQKYKALMMIDRHETRERGIITQEVWNALVRARKQETGTGFYLGPEEHKAAVVLMAANAQP
jgi:hypothetical protein